MKKIFREIVNLTVMFHIKRFRKDRKYMAKKLDKDTDTEPIPDIFLNSIIKSTKSFRYRIIHLLRTQNFLKN